MNITWKKLEDQSYEGFDENGNRYRQPANQETTTVYLTDGRTGQGWTPEKAVQHAEEKAIVTRDDRNIIMKHGPRYEGLSMVDFNQTTAQHDTNEGMVRFYCTLYPNVWKLQIRAFQPLQKDHVAKGLKPRNLIASVSITLEQLEEILNQAKESLNE